MHRPVIQLHRPWTPDPAAESIQVLHAAHGLARHRPVTVLMRASRPVSADEVLAAYGLARRDGLSIHVLPTGGTAASLAFWRGVWGWWWSTGGQGIALARTPRYALRARAFAPELRLVGEVHGLGAPGLSALVAGANLILANSAGTAHGVRAMHPGGPVHVLHNAARGPGPVLEGPGVGIGYVGSVRPGKGLETLARLSDRTDEPVVVVTADEAAARALGGRLVVEPALPPGAVPERLARFRCLVVPLAPGVFGEVETCPLKWFDAAASGRPVVVADAPTMEALAPSWVPRFRMGDAVSLGEAVERAVSMAERFAQARPHVPTWDDRGDRLHGLLSEAFP